MANTTWNPSDKSANITLTGSNLIATVSTTNGWVRAADKQITGKFYWEVTATTTAAISTGFGIAAPAAVLTAVGFNGAVVNSCGLIRSGASTSNIYVDGVSVLGGMGTLGSGAIICIALDATNRLIWFRIGAAGNWNANASNNPATSVGGIACTLGLGIPAYPTFYGASASEAATANFGDTAFTGAVPSGFTSGFTAGVTSPTNVLDTQTALEEFFATNPDNQTTQVGLEMWASTATVSGQNMVTQVALEMWASAAAAAAAGRTKVWNGTSWVIKPVKVWNGSAWV